MTNSARSPVKKNPRQKPAANPARAKASLPAHLTPGNPGNAGGKAGRSGRKPLAFLAACEALADTTVLAKVRTYLAANGPGDAAWRWCAEYVTRYTKVEPKRPVELTGENGAPIAFTLDIRTPVRPTEANGRTHLEATGR